MGFHSSLCVIARNEAIQGLCNLLTWFTADMYHPLCQLRQCLQAFFQPFLLALHDEIIIRSKWSATETANKNGLRCVIGVGHYAKRSLAHHGPKTTLQHGRLDVDSGHRWRGFVIRACRTSGFEIRFDHHLQQSPLLTSYDSLHLSADGRSEADALVAFVAKQSVTYGHGIAFLNQQTWCEPHEISGFHGIS